MSARDSNNGADLSPEDREILQYLLDQEGHKITEGRRIPRRRDGDVVPLSFGQQRFWFLEQLAPGNPALHFSQHMRLSGVLRPEALKASLQAIIRRHEILRTTFRLRDGTPVQVIAPESGLEMPVVDLTGLDEEMRGVEISRLTEAVTRRPFDLANGPLLRVKLLKLGPDDHVLLFTMHHILTDRWSLGILMRELGLIYGAQVAGEPASLPELPIQYGDFALWEQQRLRGKALERQLGYWRRQLTDLQTLQLPTDFRRPAIQSYSGLQEFRLLPKALSEGLRELGRTEGITPFMMLLGAVGVLLHRYSRQEDIVVGSPIVNRTRTELEGLVGFFTNTIVLRMDFSGEPSVRELLQRVRKTTLDAYAHQDLPFERLVDELKPVRDLSRSPIFQALFVQLNDIGESVEPISAAGLKVGPVPVSEGQSGTRAATQFDLELYVGEQPGGLSANFVYNPDLFEAETIRRVAEHFQKLLEGMVSDPECRVSRLPLLSDAERHRVLEGWNATERDFPSDCVHQLFELQVKRSPGAVAVEAVDGSLTYAELNGRSNRLARHLRASGVGPGVLVGLCVDRKLDLMVSVLAVMKAGGAYVPLDPTFPRERLKFMVEDARLFIILMRGSLSDVLPESNAVRLDLAIEQERASSEADSNLDGVVGPDDLAYIIYTSGSTGRPKGVRVEHRSLTNFAWALRELLAVGTYDGLLSIASLSFDASVLDLYVPLISGGRVILATRETARDGIALAEAIESNSVTMMHATPATWQLLLSSGWNGNRSLKVLSGGEALPLSLASQLRTLCGSVHNLYGPTEATVYSTVSDLSSPEDRGFVSIGRPIANTRIYVLDSALQPVPMGVVGELCIGGVGVARDYLNRMALTADRFVADPFAGDKGARMYRTGDLARYRSNGSLECFGRTDHQIKIRGYRIELGEVEAVLTEQEHVRQAVVLCREDLPGDKRLVAYLVPESGGSFDLKSVQNSIRKSLPSYMVPNAFVVLDELPLTPSAKVDRDALPAPERKRSAPDASLLVPGSEMERLLTEVWTDLLEVEPVSVLDNFFDLGGHSLLTVEAISKMKERTGVAISPMEYMMQNLRQIAAIYEREASRSRDASRDGLGGRIVSGLRRAGKDSSV